MANLLVLKFDTPDGAEKGLELVRNLQRQHVVEVLDAATVSWPKGKNKPRTRQWLSLGAVGALDGAFWGMLLGFIFFMPLLGMAIGAAMGGLSGHFKDYGIDDTFIAQVRSKVIEGTSGLFLLLGAVTTDRVVEAFKSGPHFEIIASNLTRAQEARLKDAFT